MTNSSKLLTALLFVLITCTRISHFSSAIYQVEAVRILEPQQRNQNFPLVPSQLLNSKPNWDAPCYPLWKLTNTTSNQNANSIKKLQASCSCRRLHTAYHFRIHSNLSECFISCTNIRTKETCEFNPRSTSILQFETCCTACSGDVLSSGTAQKSADQLTCQSKSDKSLSEIRTQNRKLKTSTLSISSVSGQALKHPTPNVRKVESCFPERVELLKSNLFYDYDGNPLKKGVISCTCYQQWSDYPVWMLNSKHTFWVEDATSSCVSECLSRQKSRQCAIPPKITAQDGAGIMSRDCCNYCNAEFVDTHVLTGTGERELVSVCSARNSMLRSVLPTPSAYPTVLKVSVPPSVQTAPPSHHASKDECAFRFDSHSKPSPPFLDSGGEFFDSIRLTCDCETAQQRETLDFPVATKLSPCVNSCLSTFDSQSCGKPFEVHDASFRKRLEATYQTCCFSCSGKYVPRMTMYRPGNSCLPDIDSCYAHGMRTLPVATTLPTPSLINFPSIGNANIRAAKGLTSCWIRQGVNFKEYRSIADADGDLVSSLVTNTECKAPSRKVHIYLQSEMVVTTEIRACMLSCLNFLALKPLPHFPKLNISTATSIVQRDCCVSCRGVVRDEEYSDLFYAYEGIKSSCISMQVASESHTPSSTPFPSFIRSQVGNSALPSRSPKSSVHPSATPSPTPSSSKIPSPSRTSQPVTQSPSLSNSRSPVIHPSPSSSTNPSKVLPTITARPTRPFQCLSQYKIPRYYYNIREEGFAPNTFARQIAVRCECYENGEYVKKFTYLEEKYSQCLQYQYTRFVSDRERATWTCERKKIKKDFKKFCKACGGKVKNMIVGRLTDTNGKKMKTCI